MIPNITPLKVRDIDFKFPDDIPFQWNPGNPHWGNFVNFITLIAPAFEGYFVKAFKDAIPRIRDPEVAEEAENFCLQERQHSRYHLKHVKLLIKKHPGLEDVFLDVKKSYNELYRRESLEFHLGYAAVLELFFGPVAKFVIENRESMFKGADPRISSFILWHLVEEFEHRNSAYNVYNDIVDSYPYRMKMVVSVFKHISEIAIIARKGMESSVSSRPGEDGPSATRHFMRGTSMRSRLQFFYELFCTLLPLHNPNSIREPEWVTKWFEDEEAGLDMTVYYPQPGPK